MLTEDASLEDELGIDSVKQVEIFALLREKFGISKEITFKGGEIKSIGDIARWLQLLKQTSLQTAEESPVRNPAESTLTAVPATAPVVVLDTAASTLALSAVSSRSHLPPSTRTQTPTVAATLMGKIVLVTGSGRGLGRSLATSLAAEGATVIVNSFHSRDAGDATCADIVQAGGKAIHLWGSVANEEHVGRIFGELAARFGRLDAFVANASDGFIGPFEALTAAHWERGFRTNVVGLHQCAVAASKLMIEGGQIVTMSTVTSSRYLRDFTCQGVLKAAVESLTRYLAVEFAPRGVRVNCISAGPVYGELLHRFPNAESRIATWTSLTPAGELTDPDEVARLAAFLISGALRSATGSVITLDGGMSLSIDGDVSADAAKRGVSLVG
jgi:NAD(P)-dependent dehydrogenase (short-subunit alcohol dehydrogenase family)